MPRPVDWARCASTRPPRRAVLPTPLRVLDCGCLEKPFRSGRVAPMTQSAPSRVVALPRPVAMDRQRSVSALSLGATFVRCATTSSLYPPQTHQRKASRPPQHAKSTRGGVCGYAMSSSTVMDQLPRAQQCRTLAARVAPQPWTRAVDWEASLLEATRVPHRVDVVARCSGDMAGTTPYVAWPTRVLTPVRRGPVPRRGVRYRKCCS